MNKNMKFEEAIAELERTVKALEDGKMRGTVSSAVVASYEKTLKLGK